MTSDLTNNTDATDRRMPPARLTAVVAVIAVDLHRRFHAAVLGRRAAAPPAMGPLGRQQVGPARRPGGGAEGHRRGGGGRRQGGVGRGGGEAGEVGGDLSDGSDWTRADVDGHVFLDGDAELLPSLHRHRVWKQKHRFTAAPCWTEAVHQSNRSAQNPFRSCFNPTVNHINSIWTYLWLQHTLEGRKQIFSPQTTDPLMAPPPNVPSNTTKRQKVPPLSINLLFIKGRKSFHPSSVCWEIFSNIFQFIISDQLIKSEEG